MDRLDEELALLKDVQRDIQNLNTDIIEKNLDLMTENERLSNQNFDLRTEVEKQKESIVRHIKNEDAYIKKIDWADAIISRLISDPDDVDYTEVVGWLENNGWKATK